MKLPLRFLLMSAAFAVSCQTEGSKGASVGGEYVSKSYGFIEWLLLPAEAAAIGGNNLKLNADSSYLLQTCGNLISGHWRIDKTDSLVLFCTTNIKLRDKSKQSCGTAPMKYAVKQNGSSLYRTIENGKLLLVDCLVKKQEQGGIAN